VIEDPIVLCIACVLCAKLSEVTDIPIAAPMLHSRLNNDAPSLRSDGDNVENDSTCNVVDTNPSPAPWMTALHTRQRHVADGLVQGLQQRRANRTNGEHGAVRHFGWGLGPLSHRRCALGLLVAAERAGLGGWLQTW
jgi:hypothetical protein